MGICLIWLKMFLLLNCISNCSSRHGFRVKAWNQSRKFDKFCLFSPVREKCIVERKIRIWLLLQMFRGQRKMFGGESIFYGFVTAACLFVGLFYFFWNWMNISLKISLLFWKVLRTALPFSWIIRYFWLHIFSLSTQCLHIVYSMY